MRRIIFWMHLACGVSARLVIFMMSITGVILTYELQLLNWDNRGYFSHPVGDEVRKPFSQLLHSAQEYAPQSVPGVITIASDPSAPITGQLARDRHVYLSPYSGIILGEGNPGLWNFSHAVTGWHRWYYAGGEHREPARAITGACNLMFLLLIIRPGKTV